MIHKYHTYNLYSRTKELKMFKHKIICISVLLLKISCNLAEQSYVVSEPWTSGVKSCSNQTNLNEITTYDKYYMHMKSINFINLPILSIIFAQSEYLPNGHCKQDVLRYLNELQRGTLWAAQMFDASSKYPDGILYGHTRHLGNFDECYNLQVDIERKDTGTGAISGKYCLVDLLYEKKHTLMTSNESVMYDFDPNKLVWEAIKEKGNFLRIRRYHLQLALCVPSSCKAKDIEIALRKPLQQINVNNGIEIYTTVQSKFCQAAEEKPRFTTSAKIYCTVLLGLLSLIIGSTWYDFEFVNEKKYISTFQNVIPYFSVRRNFKNIFQINNSHPELESLYIIRLVLSIYVLGLHYGLRYLWTPIINMTSIENIYTVPILTSITNGSISTDMFLSLGGLLLAHSLLKTLDKKRRLNFISNVLSRYLRLTPSYAIILFFFTWIFPLLNSGPFWKREVEEQAAICATNWWANLLYIHNYVKSLDLCMYYTWYLSVDFQLFILGHFVIFVFWRLPRKIGYLFLAILTIISCIIPAVATYSYGISPIFHITPILHDVQEIPYFKTYYIKTHVRCPAYLVGIITGAILYDHKQINWQISKFWSHVLILPLPLTVYIAFLLWSFKIYVPYGETSILEDAFYAFFYRLIPSLCLSISIILLCVGRHIECYTSFINFVSPRWVKVLSRLTFQVYFIGEIIHIFCTGRVRTARVASIFDAVWDIVRDTIFAFALSLPLAVCVEEPFRKIAKQIFPN